MAFTQCYINIGGNFGYLFPSKSANKTVVFLELFYIANINGIFSLILLKQISII